MGGLGLFAGRFQRHRPEPRAPLSSVDGGSGCFVFYDGVLHEDVEGFRKDDGMLHVLHALVLLEGFDNLLGSGAGLIGNAADAADHVLLRYLEVFLLHDFHEEEFVLHIDLGLVQEGLRKIADKFATVIHAGPKFVADFEDVQEPEERAALMRDAFEKMDYLLRTLKIR